MADDEVVDGTAGCGVDGDDVEGEARGGGRLREQAGAEEERRELHGEIAHRGHAFKTS